MRWLVVVALLAPLAVGDHVYSHRLLVEGRLIGGDGLPIPGRVVDFRIEGQRLEGACRDGHKQVTDEFGDFWFCHHVHALDPAAVVTVASGNASGARAVDVDLRRMVFYLRDGNATGVAPPEWASTFHLDGRVWERGRARLEQVNVSGLALEGVPVNVTLLNGSATTSFTTRTNAFGDYGVVLRASGDAFAVVRVEAAALTAPLDPAFHRTTLDVLLPVESPPTVAPPGSRSGPISVGLVIVMALALVVAVALARRTK